MTLLKVNIFLNTYSVKDDKVLWKLRMTHILPQTSVTVCLSNGHWSNNYLQREEKYRRMAFSQFIYYKKRENVSHIFQWEELTSRM